MCVYGFYRERERERERERRYASSCVKERGCVCQTSVRKGIMNIREKNPKKTQKENKNKSKRMTCMIRERMQTFAYIHQFGRTRILGTMPPSE